MLPTSRCTSHRTIFSSPEITACISGVFPDLSCTLTATPCSISILTHPREPYSHAHDSAHRSESSRAPRFDFPDWNNISIVLGESDVTAQETGDAPKLSGTPTSMSSSSSRRTTTWSWPAPAASDKGVRPRGPGTLTLNLPLASRLSTQLRRWPLWAAMDRAVWPRWEKDAKSPLTQDASLEEMACC